MLPKTIAPVEWLAQAASRRAVSRRAASQSAHEPVDDAFLPRLPADMAKLVKVAVRCTRAALNVRLEFDHPFRGLVYSKSQQAELQAGSIACLRAEVRGLRDVLGKRGRTDAEVQACAGKTFAAALRFPPASALSAKSVGAPADGTTKDDALPGKPNPMGLQAPVSVLEAQHLTKGAAVGHVEELPDSAAIAGISEESSWPPKTTPPAQLDIDPSLPPHNDDNSVTFSPSSEAMDTMAPKEVSPPKASGVVPLAPPSVLKEGPSQTTSSKELERTPSSSARSSGRGRALPTPASTSSRKPGQLDEAYSTASQQSVDEMMDESMPPSDDDLVPSGVLHRLDGSFTADVYIDVLRRIMLPFVLDGPHPNGNFLLQQDRSPAHTACRVSRCLDALCIEELPWPPKGAD
ncbi:hypothetical protein ISCGN_011205 [Ixodes scapularis]